MPTKECRIKFILEEDILKTIAEEFNIDLSNKKESNKQLKEIIGDYIEHKIKISKDIEVEIKDIDSSKDT